MPSVVVRNLSDETHRALKARAKKHGRSAEAEIRAILDEAVTGRPEAGVGSRLAAFGRRLGGIELDIERDKRPAEPASFE